MKRLLPVLVLGCHATASLDPPVPTPGARSMLLLAVAEEYQVAFAIDVPQDGSAPAFPTFTRPSEIDLYAVNFACPLEVLGMEPGRQDFVEPAARIELPAPDAILTSHDGAEQSAWTETELSTVDALLRGIRLPPQNLCRLYGFTLAPLNFSFTVGTSTPTALVPLRNGKVLVANADHTFYEVDADRMARYLPGLDGAPNRDGFQRSDGTVILVDDDGTIVESDLEGDMRVLQTESASVSELLRVAGSSAGTIEIFRTSFDGGPFERWTEGMGWEKLTDGGARFDYGSYAVAWIQSNEAIATGVVDGTNSAFRYKNGAVIEERVAGIKRPTAIADIPGIGLVVGTEDGVILRYEDGRFEISSELVIDSQVRVVLPTERGFFYGRTRWASWDPIGGYCEQETGSADGTRVAPLGDRGFIAIGDLYPERFRRRSFLFTLDRMDLDHPCLGK